jgi:cytochrome b561
MTAWRPAAEDTMAADATYSLPARLAHWVVAAFILLAFGAGLAMMRVPEGGLQDQLFDWHRSFGATIFALAAARLLWRLRHPPAPLPADTPGWMAAAARGSHWLLYVFMLGLPPLGWLGSSAFGAPVHIYWLFDLPPLVSPNRPLANVVLLTHKWAGFAFGGMVLLHIVAALNHLVLRRDGVFQRMIG